MFQGWNLSTKTNKQATENPKPKQNASKIYIFVNVEYRILKPSHKDQLTLENSRENAYYSKMPVCTPGDFGVSLDIENNFALWGIQFRALLAV